MKFSYTLFALLLTLGIKVYGTFIENLGREFEIFDNTIINIDVKFPEEKYEELMKAIQINAESTEVKRIQL